MSDYISNISYISITGMRMGLGRALPLKHAVLGSCIQIAGETGYKNQINIQVHHLPLQSHYFYIFKVGPHNPFSKM